MNKSILVLDENSIIHDLIASALDVEGLTLHHEFNPGKYVERANTLMPDLILIGNSEQDPEFELCRTLKGDSSLSRVPLVLLANSKDGLSQETREKILVDGVVRKPFEASDLQQQVSKHLNLVELIGSAFEYQQSQSTREDQPNPLANLDVLDEEVLEMLKHDGGQAAAPPGNGGEGAVLSEDALEEALQPERAFERVEEPEQGETSSTEEYDTLETLEGEFPAEPSESTAMESELEELDEADLLEEEAPEETILSPEGFDQSLDESEVPPPPPTEPGPIEVELPEDALSLDEIDQELSEGDVEMFESELDTDAPEPPSPNDYEESIPLSVRRMMELKPVFTLGQEESATEEEGGDESFTFEPEAGEVEEIQSELDRLDEIDLDEEEVREQDVEFVQPGEVSFLDEDAAIQQEPEAVGDAEPMPDQMDEELEIVDLDVEDLEAETDEEDSGFLPPLESEGEDRQGEKVDAADLPPLDQPEADTLPEEEDSFADPVLDSEPVLDAKPADEPDLDDEDLVVEIEEESPLEDAEELDSAVEAVPPSSEAGSDSGSDEDYFLEEYLGEEEIDEEQIIAAEEDEKPADQPELTEEDEKELDNLLAEEEELSGLEEIDEAIITEVDEEEEETELDQEEQDLIAASIESDRDAAALDAEDLAGAEISASSEGMEVEEITESDLPAEAIDTMEPSEEELPPDDADLQLGQEEPLIERNFNSLEEEGAGEAVEAPAEPGEERWDLEETDSGLAISGDSAGETIILGDPIGDDLSSEPPPPIAEEDDSISGIPPGFIPKESEEFPEDAVKDPFVGPEGGGDGEHSPIPRHTTAEVLEDPDSLHPVLEQDAIAQDREDRLEEEAELGPDALEEELSAEESGEEGTLEATEEMEEAFEPLASEETEGDDLAAVLGADKHEDAEVGESGGEEGAGSEFDDLFASLQAEIADNPEGERLDDILRNEGIQDRVEKMDFPLPQKENSFARSLGVYFLPADGEDSSAFPDALRGNGSAAPSPAEQPPADPPPAAEEDSMPPSSGAGLESLSLLDSDIRAKLGQVLDEIISISVRKAVQEEMPKIVERMAKED